MINTLIISTNDLKSNTIIENNLEDHVILPNIINAHLVDLQEVLGDVFFADLLNKVRTETTNTDEDFLIDSYIIPFLIQVSLYRCIPYLWSKFENSSIVLKETDTQKSIDLDQLKFLRSDIKNDLDFIKQRLIRYLCDKSSLFPSYNNPDLLNPSKSAYNTTGIYLGGIEDECCKNIFK
jgi:hypothetical protein